MLLCFFATLFFVFLFLFFFAFFAFFFFSFFFFLLAAGQDTWLGSLSDNFMDKAAADGTFPIMWDSVVSVLPHPAPQFGATMASTDRHAVLLTGYTNRSLLSTRKEISNSSKTQSK
jgi:hypothetical protein